MNSLPSFSTLCAEGYFFCHHCDHVVKLPDDAPADEKQKCPKCKKREVIYYPPIPDMPKPPTTSLTQS